MFFHPASRYPAAKFQQKTVLFLISILFPVAAFLLTGCGIPIPEDKYEYVGHWQSSSMILLIQEDGSIRYRRVRNGSTTKISAPIQEFKGDDFVVGVWFLKTTFKVNKRPYPDGSQWKMVVDGVELTQTNGPENSNVSL